MVLTLSLSIYRIYFVLFSFSPINGTMYKKGGRFVEGQIVKALSGFYYVESDGVIYQTRGRGNFRKRKLTPLVGDFVSFESDNVTDGYLLELHPRRNQLMRPQVANIDLAVIVMSAVEPDFSTNLLDRFLTQLEFFHIAGLIYISKLDLVADQTVFEKYRTTYEKIGYPVIFSDAPDALENLTAHFPHKLTVFMGQSGAGKSTLLNKLSPELSLATAEISESLGRGKHTTRHVELHPLFDGLLADTPGFSSLDFPEMELTQLGKLFPEFLRASTKCKFRECLHLNEPECEVKAEVENKLIAQSRYDNYVQFFNEIKNKKPIYRKKEN